MAQVCPNCGASSPQEARFCRLCGTPLRRDGAGVSDLSVSPIAQTVPLTGESRSTDGLPPDDPRRPSPDTSRVAHAEIERLLKEGQDSRAPEKQDSGSPGYISIPTSHAASESSPLTTSRLVAPTIASTQAPDVPAAALPPAQKRERTRKVWPIAVAALLLVALAGGVLIYILARNRASSESKSSANAPAETNGSSGEIARVNGTEGASTAQSVAPQPSVARPEPSAERTANERASRNHLSEEDAASNSNATLRAAAEQPRTNAQPAAAVAADHYKRGVELWGQNRQAAIAEFRVAAQSNPDAYYYLGLNLVEGHDPRTLQRAELVAALQYFQLAQRGAHRAEAAQYAERLGHEYDRRRNQR
ncbi:MAG: hypothetical protein AUG51_20300 [Acidobacteria bacterium 13_1_20CM_3_53_8]|nr:MAG: hypothetical protein AUG51_20300 [Acidobacteria bacterium 13_1_20CM_3_53_8]